MGKPRLIILIRHAQSEGNKNREIHQSVPDHRVKLTPEGKKQAIEAGRKLRALLRPDDTLHFYTSPYRRTRETTEGILSALTSDDPTPSPFPRHTIKVYEEPRLREQDFGNFQPDSKEMTRMWHERAEYGHFFYRIPNGESAADAYDRVSGFNETLWRSFGEQDFASVCVLVTHGLMTRVFLMKWYHWSVEYFEDLRNINHCEFIVMQMNPENGKYVLKNQLRTWTQYKLERAEAAAHDEVGSPIPPRKQWGHPTDVPAPPLTRPQRQNTADLFREDGSSSLQQLEVALQRKSSQSGRSSEKSSAKHEPAIAESAEEERNAEGADAKQPNKSKSVSLPHDSDDGGDDDDNINLPEVQAALMPTTSPQRPTHGLVGNPKRKNKLIPPSPFSPSQLAALRAGRDGGGSRSGIGSREGSSESESDEGDLELSPPTGGGSGATRLPVHSKTPKDMLPEEERVKQFRPPRSMAMALSGVLNDMVSPEERLQLGPAMADALGDQSDMEDDEDWKDHALQGVKRDEEGFGGSAR